MEKKINNKKGNAILDTLFIIIVLVVVGVIWFLSTWAGGIMKTDLNSDSSLVDGQQEFNKISDLPTTLDNSFVFVFIILWIGALIASYNIDTHPVFFVITILLLLGVFFISMILGNSYEEITTDSDFGGHYLSYPKMHWILTHMLLVAIFVGASVTVALFAKPK